MKHLDSASTEHTTDPALLRVIHRVAHREHLHRSTRPTQFTRRRPVTGPAAHRTVLVGTHGSPAGTTGRKVTWS